VIWERFGNKGGENDMNGSKWNWISISNRERGTSDQRTGSTEPHLNVWVSILNGFGTSFVSDEHVFDFGTKMKKKGKTKWIDEEQKWFYFK